MLQVQCIAGPYGAEKFDGCNVPLPNFDASRELDGVQRLIEENGPRQDGKLRKMAGERLPRNATGKLPQHELQLLAHRHLVNDSP